MTTNIMSCNDCDELFAGYFEGDLDVAEQARMESHIASCARCQGLVRDIDGIRAEASSMPDLVPSRDLWEGIEARIQPRVISIAPARRTTSISRSFLATAAAGLIVVSSSVTYVATTKTMQKEPAPRPAAAAPVRVAGATVQADAPPPRPPVGDSAPAVTAPATRLVTPPRTRQVAPAAPRAGVRPTFASTALAAPATAALGEEIQVLEGLLIERRNVLEPETVRVVEENLAIIDAAVAQARAAVQKDPASGFLNERLESALQKKVQLLRTVALLRSST